VAAEPLLTREPFDGDVARPLLEALDAELDVRYPFPFDPPPPHDPADYAPPRGVFLVARLDGAAVGCGAVRPGPAPGTGEVKRMYVAPEVRGRRIAERVLAGLVDAATGLGYRRLVLETGTAQPEAIRLYERSGWRPTAAFGHYAESPLSRCFELDLA
jgi:GNAT superfamily N-acetyltransferase